MKQLIASLRRSIFIPAILVNIGSGIEVQSAFQLSQKTLMDWNIHIAFVG